MNRKNNTSETKKSCITCVCCWYYDQFLDYCFMGSSESQVVDLNDDPRDENHCKHYEKWVGIKGNE